MSQLIKFLNEHRVAAMLIAAGFATMASSAQPVKSPYARAASQRERVGQAPVGHAATSVQGMGKHKLHTGAPSK